MFLDLGTLDKQWIQYDETDHYMLQDGEYLPLLVKDVADWMKMRPKH